MKKNSILLMELLCVTGITGCHAKKCISRKQYYCSLTSKVVHSIEKYSDIYSRVITDWKAKKKKEIVSCKQIIKLNQHYFNKIWQT